MFNERTEWPLDKACPCGSGKSYRKCCRKKKFKFYSDADGNAFRAVPLSKDCVDIFTKAEKDFAELYGRELKDDEFIFNHLLSPTDTLYSVVQAMRRAGLPEDYVYAYYHTDGLMPTEMNRGLISETDLDLFAGYIEKFDEIASSDYTSSTVPAMVYVPFATSRITEIVESVSRKQSLVLTDFISRHSGSTQTSDDEYLSRFEVRSVLDYCIFSVLKTRKTLYSIERLVEADLPESIYALMRSVFENRLYLGAIVQDPNFFENKLLPKVDNSNYYFDTFPDGRVNYNRVIHRKSGERISVGIKIADLVKGVGVSAATRDLYTLFYTTACRFVHVDVLSARAYFHDPDPFDEINPSILAHLMALVLFGDLIEVLVKVPEVLPQFRTDVSYFLASIREPLLSALTIANADPEHKNEVFETLIDVVKSWPESKEVSNSNVGH